VRSPTSFSNAHVNGTFTEWRTSIRQNLWHSKLLSLELTCILSRSVISCEAKTYQLTIPGHLLLSGPPRLVEALAFKTCPDNDLVYWGHCFHVHICISSTTCCAGFRQWTSCCLYHHPPHAQRKLHLNHPPFKNIPNTRRFA